MNGMMEYSIFSDACEMNFMDMEHSWSSELYEARIMGTLRSFT